MIMNEHGLYVTAAYEWMIPSQSEKLKTDSSVNTSAKNLMQEILIRVAVVIVIY